MPVVVALRNRALRERHWTRVFGAIGDVLPRDETFTLQVSTLVHEAKCVHVRR